MRVYGWQTHVRNESETGGIPSKGAPSTGLDFYMIDLSKSMSVRTRKMVNYA